MAKYQIRLNIIPVGTHGEGDFHWFEDQDIPSVSEDTKYGINPRHWATTALEIMPCLILPKLTNNKEWEVEYHSESDDMVVARYKSNDGDIAIAELCDEQGFVSCRWEEEDRLPKGPTFTVFTGNGKSIACDNAHEVTSSVINTIMDNYRRPCNIRAKK